MFTYELLASVDQEVGIVIVQVGVPVLAVRGATLPRHWSPPPPPPASAYTAGAFGARGPPPPPVW